MSGFQICPSCKRNSLFRKGSSICPRCEKGSAPAVVSVAPPAAEAPPQTRTRRKGKPYVKAHGRVIAK